MSKQEILVLVHPGSACGSANFNIGRQEERAAREGLTLALDRWEGGVFVIDGGFSDELSSYPTLAQAIEEALARAKGKGLTSLRVLGDDNAMPGEPTQVERAKELALALPGEGKGVRFEVTGAWYHPQDGGGCVGSVVQALREIGCVAEVSESALELLDEAPEEEPVKRKPRRKP